MTGPSPRTAFCRVAGLGLLAFSQPLYDLLIRQPGFFAARAAQAPDILAAALLIALPAALGGLAAAWAARASARAGWLVQTLAVGCAAAALAAMAASSLPGSEAVLAAVLAGLAAVTVMLTIPAAEEFLSWLAAAALAMPALFLFQAPWPGRGPTVAIRSTEERPPVIFLLLDEFPLATLLAADGGIDAGWFPNFARLSHAAAWYRDARTVSDDTFKAVPAILTGTLPRPPKAPWYGDYPKNLFTLLAPTHGLNVLETHTALCPPSLCEPNRPPAPMRLLSAADDLAILYAHTLVPRAWSGALPSISHSWKDFGGEAEAFSWKAHNAKAGESFADRAGVLKRFINGLDRDDAHALNFLHVMLPHPPWVFFPSGTPMFSANEPIVWGDQGRADRWENDADVVMASWQRHILQARFVDRAVGALMDRLKAVGLWDGAVVVVCADHGAAFRPGGRRRELTGENAGEILPVPLFIKYPGGAPSGVQRETVSLADVLPTVLDAAQVDVPTGLDGRSLLRRGTSVPLFVDRAGRRIPAGAGYEAARKEAGRRRLLLGDGARPDALYRIGPAGALVGRPVAGLPRASAPPCRFRLNQPVADAAFSRAFLTGTVSCPGHGADRLAVAAAVGGRIVATRLSGSFSHGEAKLRLIVPERVMKPGVSADLYAAVPEHGRFALSPLSVKTPSWELRGEGPAQLLVGPKGRALSPSLARGSLEAPELDKDIVELRGNARRPAAGRTAAEVIVFSGTSFLYSGGADPGTGRFDFALPRDAFLESGGRLRVFAVDEAGAWELTAK